MAFVRENPGFFTGLGAGILMTYAFGKLAASYFPSQKEDESDDELEGIIQKYFQLSKSSIIFYYNHLKKDNE